MSNQVNYEELARLVTAEDKVKKYLLAITNNQIGTGDDPIGFLIASHAALFENMKKDFGRGVEMGYRKAALKHNEIFDEGFETGYEEAMSEQTAEERACYSGGGETGFGDWPDDDEEDYPNTKTWVN